MKNCPVCVRSCTSTYSDSGYRIDCQRCGKFQIGAQCADVLSKLLTTNYQKKANVSGWIREHQNELISSDSIEFLQRLPIPPVSKKALKLLRHLERKTKFPGYVISSASGDSVFHSQNPTSLSLELEAAAWVSNITEYRYIYQYLEKQNYIQKEIITPDGFAYLDKEKYSNAESQLGFCAMWFSTDMKTIWDDGINPAILAAGYEPKRIDEHHHNNRIDDEIIAMIRRSKFVVADFTGQRGGVYFEAGFALGMNLPVIWTVEKSELEKIHFDNRQYNFVTWEKDKLPEFQKALQLRIESTLGRGKYQPT